MNTANNFARESREGFPFTHQLGSSVFSIALNVGLCIEVIASTAFTWFLIILTFQMVQGIMPVDVVALCWAKEQRLSRSPGKYLYGTIVCKRYIVYIKPPLQHCYSRYQLCNVNHNVNHTPLPVSLALICNVTARLIKNRIVAEQNP